MGKSPCGRSSELAGGSMTLDGDGDLVTAVGTWTGVGLCTQELVYDRGSFAALRAVPGFQVLVWWSSIRTGWPGWSGSRGWAFFLVVIVTIGVLLSLKLLLNLPRIRCKACTVGFSWQNSTSRQAANRVYHLRRGKEL